MTRSRRLWLTFVGGPMVVLVMAAMAFFLVVWCSGDLEPLRQRARAHGIPATRAELGLPIRPDYLSAKARVDSLAARAQALLATQTPVRHLSGPGADDPAELIDKVANIPRELHDDIKLMLADLARSPLHVPLDMSPNSMPSYSIRRLAYWRMTAMAYGTAVDLPSATADMEDYLKAIPSINTNEYTIRQDIMELWWRWAQARLADWPRPDLATANRIRQWSDHLENDFRQGCQGDVAWIGESLTINPLAQARDMGIALSTTFEYPGVLATYQRLGRVGLFEKLVNQAVAIRGGEDPDRVLDREEGCPCGHGVASRWDPVEVLGRFYPLIPQRRYAWERGLRLAVRLRTLATFLANEPLLTDPFDPSGAHLRTQTKDGVAFAYYSVGPNGLDDGGKGDDIRCLRFAVEPEDPPAPNPGASMMPPPSIPPDRLAAFPIPAERENFPVMTPGPPMSSSIPPAGLPAFPP